MENKKISIIIPIYNTEKYLNKCIESLIEQTHSNIEILCINDGSVDNSLEILKEYARLDVRVKIFSQKNSGSGPARNLGLKNATGEYIMFCDSDDWFEANMCQKMLYKIINEEVDLVICSSNVVYEYINSRRSNLERCYQIQEKLLEKIILTDNLRNTICVGSWAKIFKKNIIDKYNILFPEQSIGEDNSFFGQYIVIAKNIFGIEEKLYNYRVRENSLMTLFYNQESKGGPIEYLYSFVHLSSFYKKNNLLEKNKYFFLLFIKDKIMARYKYLPDNSYSSHVEFFMVYQQIIKDINFKAFNVPENMEYLIEIQNGNFAKAEIYFDKKTINFFNYKKMIIKYYRYNILSKITFSKTRKKYKQKRKDLKARLKEFNQKNKGEI